VVDFPDPEDSTEFDFDRGSDGMPDRTRRAFQAHADQELGDRPAEAIAEIGRVFTAAGDAVVAVSGGKDSMTALALAEESGSSSPATSARSSSRIPRTAISTGTYGVNPAEKRTRALTHTRARFTTVTRSARRSSASAAVNPENASGSWMVSTASP